MLDFRVRKPSVDINWRYQEIIVTEEYLSSNAEDPNLITLDYEYELGKKSLDVYYNGQRLTEGGGYEEVDNLHIRLDIRGYDDQGNQVPAYLQVGDEIVIKEWFNSDSILYGQTGLNKRLTALEKEVKDARNYSDDNREHESLRDRLNDLQDRLDNIDIPDLDNLREEVEQARDGFPSLDDRLDYIQQNMGSGGGSDETLSIPLNYNGTIIYELDSAGNIVREISTGYFPYTKTMVYDGDGRILTEVTVYEGKTYAYVYEYDQDGNKVREHGEKVGLFASLTLHNYMRPTIYGTSVEYTLDDDGNIVKEVSTGDIEYEKTFEYDSNGKVVKETFVFAGDTYERVFAYDAGGHLQSESGYVLSPVSVQGRAVGALHRRSVKYTVDDIGNVIKEEVTGKFNYTRMYSYNDLGQVDKETVMVGGTAHERVFQYQDDKIIVTGTFVVEYGDKLDVSYILSGTIGKSIDFLLGEGDYDIEFEYDANGNIVKEVVTGEFPVVKEYEYNSFGKISKETFTRHGRKTVRTYSYDQGGRLLKVTSETLR